MKNYSVLLLFLLLSGSISTPLFLGSGMIARFPAAAQAPVLVVTPVADAAPVPIVAPSPQIERVLIVSFDGMRTDAIEAAPMNNLIQLMGNSAYNLTTAITIAYPVTLPSHAAMLSGMCMDKNGIYLNKYFKYMGYSQGTDIFDLAHAAGLRTVMEVGKDKLRQIAEPETTDVFEVQYEESLIGEAAVEQISQGFGLMFVHFPSADEVGHKYGWMGGSYLLMLRNGDEAFGKMLAALDANGLLDTTLIIVTADHGGHDSNHTGFLIEDYRIPWVASGPGIVPGEITARIHTMDTAATVAYALGFPQPEEWDGIPVYEAFGEPRLKIHPESVQWPCHQWN
ncbi:MAG TPA: alkaline phosphatase family protein [Anaerolineales bacterium]|nr:alkaline phosphatase family protein [Anaerolineales bacterium]HNN13261.1 alkaline phosphatase family protein [Anaerolineales bacterium]